MAHSLLFQGQSTTIIHLVYSCGDDEMIQVTKLGQSNLNVKGKQRMVNTIPILEPRIFSGVGAGARTFAVNEAL